MSLLTYAIPPILQLETTTACNLDCPFCLRKDLCRSDEYLSFDAFCRIIDSTHCRYVTLHGWGEPLMHPDLPDMIRYAAGHKKSVNFTSNATLLDKKADVLLASGLDAIAFSLPDLDRFTPQISENISRFAGQRNGCGQKTPEICINIALMEDTLSQVDAMLETAKNLGADTVVFERSYPWTVAMQKNEGTLFKKIQKSATEHALIIKLPLVHTNPCLLIRYTLFVRWNGDVAPCCYRADVSLGNILSDSMVRILQNRAKFMKSQKSDPICRKCKT
ncbi:radical SAM protein [Methanoregula sp. UBA64]|jgi:MoaA/NifB/PqqE/SkfB family radical SAM enzyme|uniref:radical SAM protein n=1 Tax=Methanoregula sp. UBA64 TaxID=1915554 RepID=UPI0025DA615D|nr:radical SAM protein [Methanoregula sp. UBA64]